MSHTSSIDASARSRSDREDEEPNLWHSRFGVHRRVAPRIAAIQELLDDRHIDVSAGDRLGDEPLTSMLTLRLTDAEPWPSDDWFARMTNSTLAMGIEHVQRATAPAADLNVRPWTDGSGQHELSTGLTAPAWELRTLDRVAWVTPHGASCQSGGTSSGIHG
jgi:hypothetical protein